MISSRIDIELLERFEKGLDPLNPHRSEIPAHIIGYGEISTIFEILDPSQQGLAFKRLPIFRTRDEMDQYERLFLEYNRLLGEDIGIRVPSYCLARIYPPQGNMVIYNVQERLPAESICNSIIRNLPPGELATLLRSVLMAMKKVWAYNEANTGIEVGLDSQISNWAISGGPHRSSVFDKAADLIYIDTGTPLMKINGVEQLNSDLFLRSAPSFLVWLIKRFFLDDVLNRYYDFHLVVVDLIANLYKEQRKDVVPLAIDTANSFFETELAELCLKPITLKEVTSYYREDAFIWRLYLALRKFDRFLHTRIFHQPYPYILPGKITR
ncbi:MAG TPA: hypothetical protein ENN05_05495 [Deltaproteobacteria bacterium]|nr:hypothetical protein [Deltaproteobacteria bacterium]